jgi:hypothetical protein
MKYQAMWVVASLIKMLRGAAAAEAAAAAAGNAGDPGAPTLSSSMVVAPAAAAAAGGIGSAEAAAHMRLDDAAFTQIAALLTTCLKAAAGYTDDICSSNLDDSLATTTVVALVMEAAAAAGRDAFQQLLSIQGRSLALFGRSMAAICSFNMRVTAPLHSSDVWRIMPAFCSTLLHQSSICAASIVQGLAAVQLPGEAAAAAAALAQLQQQAAAAQQQVEQHQHQLPEQIFAVNQHTSGISYAAPTPAAAMQSGASFGAAGAQPSVLHKLVFTPELCQKLVELGEAVVTQLPSSVCCNNLRCSSLAALSEQELVAGKGSVFSRCRAAR